MSGGVGGIGKPGGTGGTSETGSVTGPQVDAGGEKGAETSTAEGSLDAKRSVRPKSDMGGVSLQAQLEARLKEKGLGGAPAPSTGPAPTVPAELKTDDKKKERDWTVGVGMGPRPLEIYDPVDVRIKNDRVDVSIEGVHFLQRNSMEYYKFWEADKVADAFRWVDEPTNQLFVEARNKKSDFVIGVRAYHPKMLVSLGGDGKPNLNTSVHATGTIEGKPVDGNIDLKDTFGAIRLTHKLMDYEVTAGKSFTLAEGKAGKLKLDTSVGVGVYAGRVHVSYRDPKDYWNFISYDDEKSHVLGGEVTLHNSLTYMLSGGKVGIGAEANITKGKMSYDMMGGTMSHNVSSKSFAVFVKFEF